MKKLYSTHYWFIGLAILFSGVCLERAEAQLNEAQVLRQASGVYKGRLRKAKRVTDYGETTYYDTVHTKSRVPVTENNLKTKANDDEFDGTGKAKIKGDGKRANVTRGGSKVAYVVNKGVVDIVQDGHNPIKKGTAKGGMVLRNGKWAAKFNMKGKRLDNDGHTSTFSTLADGNH